MSRVSTTDPIHGETLCSARRRNGSPCGNRPMMGTTVCRMHGGAAPQVRRRAEQRILEASDKAAYTLVQLMQDPNTSDAIKLAAARDLLDRASLTGKQELSVAVRVSKWDEVSGDILMDVDNLPEIEGVVDAEVVEDDEAIEAEIVERDRERTRQHRRATGRRDGRG